MKFTILLTLLPVALAVPSVKRDFCGLKDASCVELAEKCAVDVHKSLTFISPIHTPPGFNAHKFAPCIAAAICAGSPGIFRTDSCIGREFNFGPEYGFRPILPEVITKITNCTEKCEVTAQNFVDLVYSQLSTNWPESPEFILNAWWAPLVKSIVPGFNEKIPASIPADWLSNWFKQQLVQPCFDCVA